MVRDMAIQEAESLVILSFSSKRASLNQRIDESRREIDDWFEGQPQPAPVHALAHLEALLKASRDLLQELVALDDNFVTLLLEQRGLEPDTKQKI